MAFNFNWSPLTADASFYTRAQELLTTALNKYPKPPIIVDDILVNELNLGSVPPDLEILEIGDLAEDRFRGIFKMCYAGDAFLTLKTRVQANPLNTYLSTKPSFASPQPLAASSGLTIPLQITLSEIKLSAFIILVFSRQKGLTLVFRNDPLESLKVSSTFDSIPFVREYLQKEIEGQLRTLLMDEVPAIIHRLSLRLWVPEYRVREDEELARASENSATEDTPVDPLAGPPQDPVDVFGNTLDLSQVASLSLDSSSELHSLFSQKNLLRLAALTDSHRTLSLFTPSLRDVVFRAWAGSMEHGEGFGSNTPMTPGHPIMSRSHSYTRGANNENLSECRDMNPTGRPTLSSFGSAPTGLSLGMGKHGKTHTGRKRKHRVVNLRRTRTNCDDLESISVDSTVSGSCSTSSEAGVPVSPLQEREELVTPPGSPPRNVKSPRSSDKIELGDSSPGGKGARYGLQDHRREPALKDDSKFPMPTESLKTHEASQSSRQPSRSSANTTPLGPSPSNAQDLSTEQPLSYLDRSSGSILEQAWMMKMVGEIARRVQDEKAADSSFWGRNEREDTPPPAYGS